jgi:hypothetical protein
MRELNLAEIETVSGGDMRGGTGPFGLPLLDKNGGNFSDGQCVAGGAAIGLTGGLGAAGAGAAVGSIVPGLGTAVGVLAGLVVSTAAGMFT